MDDIDFLTLLVVAMIVSVLFAVLYDNPIYGVGMGFIAFTGTIVIDALLND